MLSFAFPRIFNDLQLFNRSKTLGSNDLPGLPDEPTPIHDSIGIAHVLPFQGDLRWWTDTQGGALRLRRVAQPWAADV